MKVTELSKKGLKTELKVIVDKKTISESVNLKFDEIQKEAVLKGFRPGKVPIEVLKKQFGKEVFGEVLQKTLKDTSSKVLEEKKFKLSGEPKIDLKNFSEDKDLEYVISVEELPKIDVKNIDNIKTTYYEINVSDKEIEKKIKEISKNQNNFTDKDEKEISQKNDMVVFDYKATIDQKDFEGGEGKNTQIVLGKDLFIKGFDNQLLKVKKMKKKL